MPPTTLEGGVFSSSRRAKPDPRRCHAEIFFRRIGILAAINQRRRVGSVSAVCAVSLRCRFALSFNGLSRPFAADVSRGVPAVRLSRL